jgi:hypothetical protein
MVKMRAIEYNLWMTLLKLMTDRLPAIVQGYNIKYSRLDVLPAYPRDLTDINKPSIIVRKVGTSQYKISMDGFIGQSYDEATSTYTDVKGVGHDSTIQFDIVADSNTQSTLLASIISEEILNDILLSDIDRGKFTLYDFTVDDANPTPMGLVTIIDTSDITNFKIAPNKNNDYVSAIRSRFDILQTIVPTQEYVDLSKWIKVTQTINI